MKVRIFAAVLALLMLAGVLASCTTGGDDTTKDTTADNAEESTTAVTDAPETKYMEDVKDYKGKTIGVLYWSDANNNEFNIEKETGVPVDDAIYYRDLDVTGRLGVDIEWDGQPGNKSNLKKFKEYFEAHRNGEVQIVAGHSMVVGALAAEGYLYDLNETRYLDFTNEWWPKNLIENCTIMDSVYFCSGDISINTLLGMQGMFFNKDLTDDGGKKYYDLVRNNKWTLDAFIAETENKYQNLDTDSAKSMGDMFGFASYSGMINPLFVGMGMSIIENDGANGLKLSPKYATEKNEKLLEKINNLFYTDNDWFYANKSFADSANIFKSGRSLFYMASVRLTINTLTDTNGIIYGILPAPLYAEGENYRTLLANTYTLYAVNSTVDADTADMCSAYLELLAYESSKTVTPAVFNKTLKGQYSDKRDDAEMFDILRSSSVMEIGLIFSDQILGGMPSKNLFTLVGNNEATLRTDINDSKSLIENDLKKLNDSFANSKKK